MTDLRDAPDDKPKVFGPNDPWPDVRGGALAVVHYGDYRRQEVWVASGANIGNWYPLGGEFWVVWDRQRMPPGVTMPHPTWPDVVARGPVTLVYPGAEGGYRQGWADGRARLVEQMETAATEGPDGRW